MHGAVRGVRRRQAGDALSVPAHRLPRGDRQVRHRQARPAQPAGDAGRLRALPRRRLRPVRRASWRTPKNAVWAMPAPGGGSRAFCDRMNAWAQGEGQPGLGYIFWREGEEGGAGPIATQHRPRARRGDPRPAGPGGRRRGVLRRRRSEGLLQVRRRWRAPRSGPSSSWSTRTGSSSAGSSTSRCSSSTRRPTTSTSRTTRSRCRRASWRR